MALILGITGKSGSGKTTFLKNLSSPEYDILDIDIIHKELVSENYPILEQIFIDEGYPKMEYKDAVSIFFKNKLLRDKINEYLFPILVGRVNKYIKHSHKSIIILDCPLLFETKLFNVCNTIWLIYCKENDNIKRLMERNNIDYEEALYRYNAINFETGHYLLFDQIINTSIPYKIDFYRQRIKYYEQSDICG